MYGYDNGLTIDTTYFNPRSIRTSSVILVIGKRGSGKSTVAEDIMSYFTHVKEGVCVSKTDKMNGFWSKHIPKLFIHHEYSDTITQKLLKHQEAKWIKHQKECWRRGVEPKTEDIEPCFAIYDDVTYDKRFLRDAATRELFMNGRHYNCLVVITCQYLMDMGPDLRNQIDYVFILKDNIRNNRVKMYEYFAGMFPSYYAFERTFIECTANREALVLHNSSLSHDLRDNVFFYRAKPNRKYMLGSPNFKGYSEEHFDSDSEDEDEQQMAGLSKRDRERSRAFSVRKIYPGEEPIDLDRNEGGRGAFSSFGPDGDSGRDLRLLANSTHMKKKNKQNNKGPTRNDLSSFVPATGYYGQGPLKNRSASSLIREPPLSGYSPDAGDDDSNDDIDDAPPLLAKRSLSRRRLMPARTKPLRTRIDTYYAPPEPFGTDLLQELNKPPQPSRKRRTSTRRRKSGRSGRRSGGDAPTSVPYASDLFLY